MLIPHLKVNRVLGSKRPIEEDEASLLSSKTSHNEK